MLETPHVIVGAAIATKIVNPALSIPLAFASHFVLEKVPHWNPHLNTELKKYKKISSTTTNIVILDSSIALAAGFYIAQNYSQSPFHALTILLACLSAALPDLIEAPYYFLHIKTRFVENVWIPFKKSVQVDTSPIPGLLTQVIIIIAAFWWILN